MPQRPRGPGHNALTGDSGRHWPPQLQNHPPNRPGIGNPGPPTSWNGCRDANNNEPAYFPPPRARSANLTVAGTARVGRAASESPPVTPIISGKTRFSWPVRPAISRGPGSLARRLPPLHQAVRAPDKNARVADPNLAVRLRRPVAVRLRPTTGSAIPQPSGEPPAGGSAADPVRKSVNHRSILNLKFKFANPQGRFYRGKTNGIR